MIVPTVIWVVVIVTFIGGLTGAIIPGLPGGIGLIWFGIALYAWTTGFEDITVSMLVILGVVAVLGALASYIGAVVGTRAAKGRKLAVSGSIIGAILGMIVAQIPGLLIAAFVGALLGAFLEGRESKQAIKTALLTVVGIVGGAVLQFLLGIFMILAFFYAITIG